MGKKDDELFIVMNNDAIYLLGERYQGITNLPRKRIRALRWTGIRGLSLQQNRAECRMDVKVLQYIMEHAHIDVTMEVYNHIGELTRIEKEIARLDSIALNA